MRSRAGPRGRKEAGRAKLGSLLSPAPRHWGFLVGGGHKTLAPFLRVQRSAPRKGVASLEAGRRAGRRQLGFLIVKLVKILGVARRSPALTHRPQTLPPASGPED